MLKVTNRKSGEHYIVNWQHNRMIGLESLDNTGDYKLITEQEYIDYDGIDAIPIDYYRWNTKPGWLYDKAEKTYTI